MNRKQNTAYMLRQWLVPVIALLVAAIFFGNEVLRGNGVAVAAVVALVVLVAGVAYLTDARKERHLLQSAALEPVLANYIRKFAQAPIADRDAAAAFSKAAALTVYGRFDEARAALAVIDWAARPPLIQAQRTLLEAWWAYLTQPDAARGLRLAEQARQLADTALAFPSAGQPLRAYEAAIALGQLLTGAAAQPGAAARLEARLSRQPLLLKALLAWGLLIYAERAGQTASAGRMRELLAKTAPHCAGLARPNNE